MFVSSVVICPFYKYYEGPKICCESAQVGCSFVANVFETKHDRQRFAETVCETRQYGELCPIARENERFYRGELEQVDYRKEKDQDTKFEKGKYSIRILTEGEGVKKRTCLYVGDGEEEYRMGTFAGRDKADSFRRVLEYFLYDGAEPEVIV